MSFISHPGVCMFYVLRCRRVAIYYVRCSTMVKLEYEREDEVLLLIFQGVETGSLLLEVLVHSPRSQTHQVRDARFWSPVFI